MPLPQSTVTNAILNIEHIRKNDYAGFLQACLQISPAYKQRYDRFIKIHIKYGDLDAAIREKMQQAVNQDSPWHNLLRAVISIKASFDVYKPVVDVLDMVGFSGDALFTCALAGRTEVKVVDYEGFRFRLPTIGEKVIMYSSQEGSADVFFWWGKSLEGSTVYKTTVLSFNENQLINKPGKVHVLSSLSLTKEALVTTFSFIRGKGVRISGAIPDTVVDSKTISELVEQRITDSTLDSVYHHCCAKSCLAASNACTN